MVDIEDMDGKAWSVADDMLSRSLSHGADEEAGS